MSLESWRRKNTLQSLNCVKVCWGKYGLFTFAEAWQSGNLVLFPTTATGVLYDSFLCISVLSPVLRGKCTFLTHNGERKAEKGWEQPKEGWEGLRTAKVHSQVCSSPSPSGSTALTALCLKLILPLFPPACNCPVTQHQDLGLWRHYIICEEETLDCKADMPFRARRFCSDNLFR